MADQTTDTALARAVAQVEKTLGITDPDARPQVTTFFDTATNTATHIVSDPRTGACAIIDSVLDLEYAAGRIHTRSAQRVLDHLRAHRLDVQWQLETHVHADHLSAAPWLRSRVGGRHAMGEGVREVQKNFARTFPRDTAIPGADAAEPDEILEQLFADGEAFSIGELDCIALHVPGHTPDCTAYLIGDCLIVGDTLFMPDYGTARCDFPGGSARQLYRSIQRMFALPDATRLFLCHDYKAPGRDEFMWETTVGAQRKGNVHINDSVSEDEFVAMREARDSTLNMPTLIMPSLQVNLRGGLLPEPDIYGRRYFSVPITVADE